MSFVRRVASGVDRLGLAGLRSTPGPLLVMYHGIGGSDGVDPEAFEQQLDLLSARRRVRPLSEVLDAIGSPEASELAAITFDDGYVDFAELAVPRLRARGLHATVFVPSGRVGQSNVWDAGFAEPRPILDAEGLRALDPEIVTIGAHGDSHCRMAGLSESALRAETLEARRKLETLLGRDVDLFAYPYGQRDDFDAAAESAVADAGFRAACSTCFGRGSQASERYRLRRVGIEPIDDLDAVRRKLDGAYDWVAWKEALGARIRRLRGHGPTGDAPPEPRAGTKDGSPGAGA